MSPVPLQSPFLRFHRKLRLTRAEQATLAQKRERLKGDLKTGLDKIFALFPTKPPRFRIFNQGSYAMNTGIRPLPGEDFDIDVGILFRIRRSDYPDPVLVKRWVFEALNRNYYRKVEYRRPCIRVPYQEKQGKDKAYHVDLAVYAEEEARQLFLAWGKPHSSAANKYWEPAAPDQLGEQLRNQFSQADDRGQFQRMVCYLKRWKDLTFPATGNQRPTGIALTICAFRSFHPVPGDDLQALIQLLDQVIPWPGIALHIQLPVTPYNDLLAKMTSRQRQQLILRLRQLRKQLREAHQLAASQEPAAACQLLRHAFGDDFPVK